MTRTSMIATSVAGQLTMTVPALESICGSWVVVSRDTGLPVLETFSRAVAEAVNQTRYEVLTALQWLVRFNRSVRS